MKGRAHESGAQGGTKSRPDGAPPYSQLHSGNTAVSYLQAKRRYYRFGTTKAVAHA